MKPTNGKIAVVIATDPSHHGVYFGYVDDATLKDVMVLTSARMCVYWPQTVRGVLGLAATGPLKGSKVGPAVASLSVRFAGGSPVRGWGR